MTSESNEIKGINHNMLQRYVEMRRKVDIETNILFGITSMLALLDTSGDDKIEVDPVALGKVHQILNNSILNIWETLDDFLYLPKAKSVLDKLEE